MQLSLPREVLTWLDDNRGSLSRQAFIVSTLIQLKDYPKNFNTEGLINDFQNNKYHKRSSNIEN